MSNFWSKALGAPAPPQQAPQPVVQQRPWWDTTPGQVTPQQPVQAVQQVQQQMPSKAQSARSTATCPECGSGNYFRPVGVPNAMEQCYHCGYNPRFAHSTAGAGIPSDSTTPTRPSRQISTANNFNPQTIVAHIK